MRAVSPPRMKALRVIHESPGCASAHVARALWPEAWKRSSKQGVRGQWLAGRAARMLYAMQQDGLVAASYGSADRTGNVRWTLKAAGLKAFLPPTALDRGIEILDGPAPPEAVGGTDDRAVAMLRQHGPSTCSQLGEYLWGRSGKSGSAPYARAAGRVLHRLERAGRVAKIYDHHRTLWSAKKA